MWLFRHQKQRYLSLDHGLPLDQYEALKNKDKVVKLIGINTGYLESKLLSGITQATELVNTSGSLVQKYGQKLNS